MAIHGNKSQNARVKALQDFKENRITALVATEVAARGLDIKELPHVVNYELPNVPEDYVHRIGRTARAGSTGAAISLVSPDELSYLRDIEKLLKRKIDFVEPPKFEIKEGTHTPRNATAASTSRTRIRAAGPSIAAAAVVVDALTTLAVDAAVAADKAAETAVRAAPIIRPTCRAATLRAPMLLAAMLRAATPQPAARSHGGGQRSGGGNSGGRGGPGRKSGGGGHGASRGGSRSGGGFARGARSGGSRSGGSHGGGQSGGGTSGSGGGFSRIT